MTAEIIATPNEVLSIHSFCDSCHNTIPLRGYGIHQNIYKNNKETQFFSKI